MQAITGQPSTAPRVTVEQIQGVIKTEAYHFNGLLAVCFLTLANGFVVLGQSACASPDLFDEKKGRELARKDAENKIWPLEGYLLKQRLYEEELKAKEKTANDLLAGWLPD